MNSAIKSMAKTAHCEPVPTHEVSAGSHIIAGPSTLTMKFKPLLRQSEDKTMSGILLPLTF